MDTQQSRIQFNRILLKVLAFFYLLLGIIMFFSPDSFLVYWDKEIIDLPYTITLYGGATNIALSLFIFEVLRIKANLLRPILFLITLAAMSIFAMLSIKAEITLSIPVYTWRFSSLSLLIVALVNELSLRKTKSKTE